jgi:hypothetical protein
MLVELRARGMKFHSLTQAIVSATPTGRAAEAGIWRYGMTLNGRKDYSAAFIV